MLRLKLVRENVLCERSRQQYAVAADEEALFGKPAMSRDEVRPRDAVAVEEDKIVPAARHERTISDFGEPESPDLLARHA